MLFNSYEFLFVFLPIAWAGYYLVARLVGPSLSRIWLCGASLVFYSWWNPAFVLVLTGSMAFNFWVSRSLTGDAGGGSKHQGALLFGAVAANLLLLFYYKYLFVLLTFLHGLGWMRHDVGAVALPIGISFFTFTQIGYLVDCRQGLVRDRNLITYVLFVTFFPHLIAGPILHHREIMPQFARAETYQLRAQNVAIGLTLLIVGLAKKVLLADSIAPWVGQAFLHAQNASLLSTWSMTLGYSMQLYFDFSGYCDMAIGLGFLFGIRLPLNFNSPYQSLSIIDFWQRWHITLTRYLTLLVYNPLAVWVARKRQRAGLPMNRQAAATPAGFAAMIALPTFVTVLLAGIWHGAGWTFIVYGAMHGIYLIINHAWRVFHRPLVVPAAAGSSTAYSMAWRLALTYAAVVTAQIVFRSPSLPEAVGVLAHLLGLYGIGPSPSSADLYHCVFILLLIGVAFATPNIYRLLGDYSPALTALRPVRWQRLAWRPDWRLATALGLLLALAALFGQRSVEFLYFQF
jgi:alginate O-acetyltransferase complex protein AlgI